MVDTCNEQSDWWELVTNSVIGWFQVEFERVKHEEDKEETTSSKIIKRTLFNRMNPFPQKKVMTFNKHTKDFGFNIKYGDLTFLSQDEAK